MVSKASEQNEGNCERQISQADLEGLREPLAGFIFSLLPNATAVEEVLQDTLILLWEKRHERRADSNLKAWAFRIARFKILSWRRDRARDRIIFFSDDMLLQIAADAEEVSHEHAQRLEALRRCVGKLSEYEKTLLRVRYTDGLSLTELASLQKTSSSKLHKQISRLRLALRHCINKQLAKLK